MPVHTYARAPPSKKQQFLAVTYNFHSVLAIKGTLLRTHSHTHTAGQVAGSPTKMKDLLIPALWILLQVAVETSRYSCLLAGLPNKQQASLVDPADKPQGMARWRQERNKALIYAAQHLCVCVCVFGARKTGACTLVLKPSAFWVIR